MNKESNLNTQFSNSPFPKSTNLDDNFNSSIVNTNPVNNDV